MWIIYSLIVLVVGIGMLTRAIDVVRLVGKSAWAERKLGVGGTITVVRFIGLALMFASFFLFRYPEMFGL
jgi:hypothetical protein